MKRVPVKPRDGWEQKIQEQGFLYYHYDAYYSEQCAYEFATNEIDQIEAATADLFDMCLEVVDHVIKKGLWDEFFIPRQYADLVKWSWENDNPSFYGRFDLGYNNGQIKLLEFNADTPTSLLEASVVQWYWLQDHNNTYDQFNSIHEKLLDHLKVCKPDLLPGKLWFASADSLEDIMNVKYIQDVAEQAGIATDFIIVDDIALNEQNQFVSGDNERIANIFKLYPYEWMFREPFGAYLVSNRDECLWIEPPYKAILSNKMLLKYLYDLFPKSPYVLPCGFSDKGVPAGTAPAYVRKPVFSREGANVTIIKDGHVLEQTGGEYGEEGFLYQQYFPLLNFDGNVPVIGSWLIGGKPAGIGIRESGGLITGNTSRFCAHYIR